MSAIELQELYTRISKIKTPKVASVRSKDCFYNKNNRTWLNISNNKLLNELPRFEQIQVNNNDFLNAITFDVDEPNLFMYPDGIAPYTVTRNIKDNKFHALYLLKEPFYTKTDKQKRVLRNDIKPQIKRLTLSLGADAQYQNTTTKNPFNEKLFNVTATNQTVVDVWYLLNQFAGEINTLETFEKEAIKEKKYLSKPFQKAYDLLIPHSQSNWKLLTIGKDETQFKANMYLYGLSIVDSIEGMSEANMTAIVNGMIKHSIESAQSFCSLQKKKSINANNTRWGNQVEENKAKIRDAIYQLVSKNVKPTMKAISLLVSLSVDTIKKPLYSNHIKTIKQELQLCK